MVSPDGSLRTENGIEYAFEGQALIGNVYTTPVYYRVPDRYITQVLYEQKALRADKGTLYLSWNEESSTLFLIPPNQELCKDVHEVIDEAYHSQVAKRPTRLSDKSKEVKTKLQSFAQKQCAYIGEFPSMRGCIGAKNQETDKQQPLTHNLG